VDLKAECDQLNLAVHTKLKQTNASAHLVQYRLRSVKAVRKEWSKEFAIKMSFKSGLWSDSLIG